MGIYMTAGGVDIECIWYDFFEFFDFPSCSLCVPYMGRFPAHIEVSRSKTLFHHEKMIGEGRDIYQIKEERKR